MKQRHSYHRLFFHVVFHVKNREPLIRTRVDEREIAGYLKRKATDLDCYLEEFGSWCEHVHLLLRTGTTIALCQLYRQLKGFCSFAWNRKHEDRRLHWGDGVYIATVDPENCIALRQYIRNQRDHHRDQQLIDSWEPPVN